MDQIAGRGGAGGDSGREDRQTAQNQLADRRQRDRRSARVSRDAAAEAKVPKEEEECLVLRTECVVLLSALHGRYLCVGHGEKYSTVEIFFSENIFFCACLSSTLNNFRIRILRSDLIRSRSN